MLDIEIPINIVAFPPAVLVLRARGESSLENLATARDILSHSVAEQLDLLTVSGYSSWRMKQVLRLSLFFDVLAYLR